MQSGDDADEMDANDRSLLLGGLLTIRGRGGSFPGEGTVLLLHVRGGVITGEEETAKISANVHFSGN